MLNSVNRECQIQITSQLPQFDSYQIHCLNHQAYSSWNTFLTFHTRQYSFSVSVSFYFFPQCVETLLCWRTTAWPITSRNKKVRNYKLTMFFDLPQPPYFHLKRQVTYFKQGTSAFLLFNFSQRKAWLPFDGSCSVKFMQIGSYPFSTQCVFKHLLSLFSASNPLHHCGLFLSSCRATFLQVT